MRPPPVFGATWAALESARRHPATNTHAFRWWLALPIAAALAYAYRDQVHAAFHLLFRMPVGEHALSPATPPYPSADGAAPRAAMGGGLAIFNTALDCAAKVVTVGTALGWIAVRRRPRGKEE